MKTTQTLVAAAALALFAGSAMAESTYGYTTGTGAISATAKVTLSVAVPKLILLRVGDSSTAVNTLSWTVPSVGSPLAPGNSNAIDWAGTAPGNATDTRAVSVYAWTNSANGGRITYAAPQITGAGAATTRPQVENFSVSATGGTGSLAHPGGDGALSANPTGRQTDFAAGTLATGTWTYSLTGTQTAWLAGTYSTTVTYTATSL